MKVLYFFFNVVMLLHVTCSCFLSSSGSSDLEMASSDQSGALGESDFLKYKFLYTVKRNQMS